MEQQSSGTYIVDKEFEIISFNKTAKNLYPQLCKGEKCYKVLMGLKSPCGPCPITNNIKGPKTYIDPIRNIQETVDCVEVPIKEDEDGYALIFSTIGNEARIAATLPKTTSELKALSVIKSLTKEYYDVYLWNISNKELTPIRQQGFADQIDESINQEEDFNKLISVYIDNNILEVDREIFRAQTTLEYILERLKHVESFKVHYRVFRNNVIHYFYAKIARIGESDDFDNIIMGFACEDADVIAKQKMQEYKSALKKVEIDSKTGLYTKEAFYQKANKMVEESEFSFDLVLMKVANLADINQQFGRNAGDRVLGVISYHLQKQINETNCIAYMGDGRFVSISKSINTQERIKSIENFKIETIKSQEVKNIVFKWAVYRELNETISIEQACDRLKSSMSLIRYKTGRDFIEYSKEISDRINRDKKIEYDFSNALKNNEIVAWYQPKYDTKTGDLIGAEALSRWMYPDGTMIHPCEFIPILEQSEKIAILDQFIFTKVCILQKHLQNKGIFIPISVNLSRASMFRNDISSIYYNIAKEFNVEQKWIPIEITESIAVRAITFKEFICKFKEKGFVFHLDDFGAGYSSLASLQVVDFETIKFDKSLIKNIETNKGYSLLKHTFAYAKENGMTVVAEGVETKKQCDLLKEINCDVIQGYYFSKPVDENAFIQLMDKYSILKI